MWGHAHNFAKAYARAIRFIDINRHLGGLSVGGATGDVALHGDGVDNNTGNVSNEPDEEPIYARSHDAWATAAGSHEIPGQGWSEGWGGWSGAAPLAWAPIDETAIGESVQGTTIEEDAQQGQQQSR